MIGYCSWCFKKTEHLLGKKNPLPIRNVYKCEGCRNYTLRCRVPGCEHFAQGHPREKDAGAKGSLIDRLKREWHAEFCAEHDGKIASFDRLDMQLETLKDFHKLFENRKTNFVKAGSLAILVVGGVVVVGFTVGAGAGMYAAALGKSGALGAASTGTAIATLNGAALSSASLAAIGGSTVGGIMVVSAVGAGLGGAMGAVITNRYFGEIKDFDILQYNEGDGPEVLFVNGFLNQETDDLEDWRDGARLRFKSNPWHLATWESKSKSDLGSLAKRKGAELAFAKLATKLAERAAKKAGSKISPLTWLALAADIAANPWHTAMVKAAMTGVVLADIIARAPQKKFVLVGHSLGARVIYYALQALSTRTDEPQVLDAILLGGAVGAEDDLGWKQAAHAVSGRIHNCLSTNDAILGYLYRGANVGQSVPIGLTKISARSRKIKNWDCSSFIEGHLDWKPKFSEVLHFMDYQPPNA